jgi:hypothetical protein
VYQHDISGAVLALPGADSCHSCASAATAAAESSLAAKLRQRSRLAALHQHSGHGYSTATLGSHKLDNWRSSCYKHDGWVCWAALAGTRMRQQQRLHRLPRHLRTAASGARLAGCSVNQILVLFLHTSSAPWHSLAGLVMHGSGTCRHRIPHHACSQGRGADGVDAMA